MKSSAFAKKIGITLAAFAVVLIGLYFLLPPNLTIFGNEKAAYNLIISVSPKFKDPSSVRVVSGKVHYYTDEEDASENGWCGWFALSATNSYGSRELGRYQISTNQLNDIRFTELDENNRDDRTSISFSNHTDDFNIDRVNEALEYKWRSFK